MREVAIPAVGFAMTEALLIGWTRQPGDAVAAGDPVAEIETDKATAELEAPVAGILGRHRFAAGDIVPVGVALTVILAPGETEDGMAGPEPDVPTAASAAIGTRPLPVAADAPAAAAPGSVDGAGRGPRRMSPRQQAGLEPGALATGPEAATPAAHVDPATDVASTTWTIAAPDAPLSIEGIAPDVALGWLREMLRIREFETRCDPLVLAGKIVGGVHLSLGQEAIAVGVAAALRPGDLAAGTHRSHHHALAMGIPSTTLMAELFGRSSGSNGGRGGSMHVAALDRGFIGGNGIVGAGVGLASGAALSAKLRDSDQVVVGYVGDGGINTGRTWESINLAAVWRLPLIVICENNLYAVETPISAVTASDSIVERARGFGIRSEAVDGQDVTAIVRAVEAAATRGRAGEGPTFIEARTYRYEGHSTGQTITYRTPEEVEDWRARDPIARLQAALTAAGALDEAGFAAMTESVRGEIDEAVAFAEAAPWPSDPDTMRNVTSRGESVRRLA